jgi:hypothetical protein
MYCTRSNLNSSIDRMGFINVFSREFVMDLEVCNPYIIMEICVYDTNQEIYSVPYLWNY